MKKSHQSLDFSPCLFCLRPFSRDRHPDPRERQDLHQGAEAERSRGADQEARSGGGQSRERQEREGAEREGQVVPSIHTSVLCVCVCVCEREGKSEE